MTAATKPLRIVIAKPGLDGHDVGAKVVCLALRDAGMEVVYTGLRKSPAQIAHVALEEGADAVGLSVLSGSHVPLTRQVLAELERLGIADTTVLVGGNIPEKDHAVLRELGVAAVFPTGSDFADIVSFLREHGHG